MKFSGDLGALRALRQRIKRLPDVQEAIATKAAPAITAQARASFDAGQTVFGDRRPSGNRLVQTGRMRSQIRFVRTGRKIRCVIGVRYARFHIRDGILPRGGTPMPVKWQLQLRDIAETEISERVGRS